MKETNIDRGLILEQLHYVTFGRPSDSDRQLLFELFKAWGFNEDYSFADLSCDNFDDCDGFDSEALQALCAAVDYFSDPDRISDDALNACLANAIRVIDSGDYIFFPGVDTYDELGMELAKDALHWRGCLPDIITNYLDAEAIGMDYERDTRGKFTACGFFAVDR